MHPQNLLLDVVSHQDDLVRVIVILYHLRGQVRVPSCAQIPPCALLSFVRASRVLGQRLLFHKLAETGFLALEIRISDVGCLSGAATVTLA